MRRIIGWLPPLLLLITACSGDTTAVSEEASATAVAAVAEAERLPADRYDQYEIVTLLPRDAIPAIDDPEFISAAAADDAYDPDELIIGVEFNGDARAYSVPYLSGHEIVNDTVGGEKIAVTW